MRNSKAYPFNTPTESTCKKNLIFSQFSSFFQQTVAINYRESPIQLPWKVKTGKIKVAVYEKTAKLSQE